MKLYIAAALAAAIGLSGCVSNEPATGKAAEKLTQTCKNYGFKPGTDAFASCYLQLDQKRIEDNNKTAMAISGTLSNMGDNMRQNSSSSRSTTCTSTPQSTWVGGPVSHVSTTCY
ncbi:hypothetical protein J2Z19_003732 [Ensifer adhaerens]|uniref:Uncharacterized protein n=1 Tax=Ensifer adhaerens TaxID=106592 RepID=A0ACC5SZF3_ENSAD|nr:hypothetical protein [Ensifer adhaerens]MBP1874013.1 hypothetical protein [Ensifer adhaerens]